MSKAVMRWWGWGDGSENFEVHKKPHFWPWVKSKLRSDEDIGETSKPVEPSTIKLPEPKQNRPFLKVLSQHLRADQCSCDPFVRLTHSYGKSLRDLMRIRQGLVTQSPDLVLYPESHEDVELVVHAAHENDVILIPFGGGSNIIGAVEPRNTGGRMVVSLHMGTMNRLLAFDEKSRTATFEAGVLGPDLERGLNARGFRLGHTPDSFEYSTLGGWLATRSAGQQSDAYGRIEDMVLGMRMATPSGDLVIKPTPPSSIGPDLKNLVLGSEGTCGVITEATMRIHPVPPASEVHGVMFSSFALGVEAIHEIIHSEFKPNMVRFLDEEDVGLATSTRESAGPLKNWIDSLKQRYLAHALGTKHPCLLLLGFDGTEAEVQAKREYCLRVCRNRKGFVVGQGVGRKWRKSRFQIPLIRDFLLDYGIMGDVAETSTLWSNVVPLYENVRQAILSALEESGQPGSVGCHISHTYPTGACLYFTFCAKMIPGQEFQQYNALKIAATEAILKNHGSLSHHHAVGYEHQPWLDQEIGAVGLKTLTGIKQTLDPKGIFNPGKLMDRDIADGDPTKRLK